MTPSDLTRLDAQLQRLHLHYIQSHYQALATKAAEQQRSHLDYLEQLVEGEATMRENRSTVILDVVTCRIDEFVATAFRRLDDRDVALRSPFRDPALKLLGDVAQSIPRQRFMV